MNYWLPMPLGSTDAVLDWHLMLLKNWQLSLISLTTWVWGGYKPLRSGDESTREIGTKQSTNLDDGSTVVVNGYLV